MKGIADTGFLVAFANRRDRYHEWAVTLARAVDAPLLTCEPVLAETAFHLRSSTVVLGMLTGGLVQLSFACNEHRARLAELAERYADRQPDLADLCLIRMSELFPEHVVVTVDREDFSVFRRNRRDVIPVVCPPQRGRRRRSPS
jgi:predicted nucleic acid-binding protein